MEDLPDLKLILGLTLTREMQPESFHYDIFMIYCQGTLNETLDNYLTYKGQAEVVHIQWWHLVHRFLVHCEMPLCLEQHSKSGMNKNM